MLDVEVVILELCRVLRGGGKRNKHGKRQDYGLMNQIVNGEQHIRSCQVGMYVQAGDCMRGGQPCSDRCEQARAAIRAAGAWLKDHAQDEPSAMRQPTLFDQEAV